MIESEAPSPIEKVKHRLLWRPERGGRPNWRMPMTGTIMLIHGAWLNSVSWEHFRPRYEARGFAVIAPDWPYDDRPPSELRTAPLPELASLGQREIIAHYEKLVRALPEPPILIGHSFGGVIVQHLLDLAERGAVGLPGRAVEQDEGPAR